MLRFLCEQDIFIYVKRLEVGTNLKAEREKSICILFIGNSLYALQVDKGQLKLVKKANGTYVSFHPLSDQVNSRN